MPAEVKHKATERMDAAMDHLKRELSGFERVVRPPVCWTVSESIITGPRRR